MGNLFKQWRLQTLKKQGLICPSEGTPVVLAPLLSSHELPFQTKKPREQTAWCADLCNSHLRITPYSPIALVSSSVACCLNKKSAWSKQISCKKANLCIYNNIWNYNVLAFFFQISFLWNKLQPDLIGEQFGPGLHWFSCFPQHLRFKLPLADFPPINFDMFFCGWQGPPVSVRVPAPLAAIPHFSSRLTLVTSVIQSPEGLKWNL